MSNFLIIAFVFVIILASIISAFFYLVGRETKRIAHFYWLKKAGLRESSHIIYVTTSSWTNFG